MTTDNPTAVPPRSGTGKGASASKVPPRGGQARKGRQSSFRARRRRRNQLVAGGVIGLVVIVVAVVVAVGLSSSSSSGASAAAPVPAATLTSVESVTPDVMAAAQAGSATKAPNLPIAVAVGSQQAPAALTSGGKPEVLYMGAEYCPYCAGERWAMVLAMSKFGTWSNLHSIASAADDNPAAIPTFTFLGSSYTSDLLSFTSVEMQTVDRKPLQNPTAAQQALLSKFDNAPYVPSGAAGGIPFVDLANSSVQDGLGFNSTAETALQHQSFSSVASQVANQSSQVGGSIAAEAGVLVSNLCKLTGGKDAVGGAACKAFPTPLTQPPAGA
ncbi:MAG TPA: DUF929 family protein [Acidimicrobiales bacterium]|nr:DUF929 family protein [Acidimicrobiales bacterium]